MSYFKSSGKAYDFYGTICSEFVNENNSACEISLPCVLQEHYNIEEGFFIKVLNDYPHGKVQDKSLYFFKCCTLI